MYGPDIKCVCDFMALCMEMEICMAMQLNRLHAIDMYKRQTCTEHLREGLKLADSLFSEGKWRVVGGP